MLGSLPPPKKKPPCHRSDGRGFRAGPHGAPLSSRKAMFETLCRHLDLVRLSVGAVLVIALVGCTCPTNHASLMGIPTIGPMLPGAEISFTAQALDTACI